LGFLTSSSRRPRSTPSPRWLLDSPAPEGIRASAHRRVSPCSEVSSNPSTPACRDGRGAPPLPGE
jgi:hypothetical protein